MATAAELLAARASGTSVIDKTLVIDNYLRMIQIPSSITNLGVENDDDVLRLNFRMPRYLGKTDLSTFSVRINYLNAKGESDVYTVSDLEIVGDNLTFSWLVGPTATKYKGNTKFNVCMRTVDADFYVLKEYNTTIATLPVLEGLECEESVVEYYSDILEQWKSQLFGIGDTEEAKLLAKSKEEQDNIANKGAEVLATIPEDYTSTYNLALEGARTKADAIVLSASGDVINVSDASDDYIRGLSIYGKTTQKTTTGAQLIPYPYTDYGGTAYADDYSSTQNGLTISIQPDHSVSIYGTLETAFTWVFCSRLVLPAGTYSVTPNPSSDIALVVYDIDAGIGYYSTFTFTKETAVRIYFLFQRPGASIYEGVYPMLNVGSTLLDYEPYTNGMPSPNPEYPQSIESIGEDDQITTLVQGKNLFDGQFYKLAFGSSQVTSYRLSVFVGSQYRSIVVAVDPTKTYSFSCGENLWGRLYIAFTEEFPVHGTRIKFTDDTTGRESLSNYNHGTVTKVENIVVPSSCRFMIIYLTNDAATYDVSTTWYQVEVGPKATAYEASDQSQLLVHQGVLRGIPVTSGGNYVDSSGQHWVCDEIDYGRGVYIQRVAVKTLNGYIPYEEAGTQTPYTYTAFVSYADIWNADTDPFISDRFVGYSGAEYKTSSLEGIYTNPGTTHCNLIIVRLNKARLDANIDDKLYAFTSYMGENPVTVYAPLLNPIETELTAEEIGKFLTIRSNYPITNIQNYSGAGMKLTYNADTKTYIDNNIKVSVTDVLEAIENGSY